MAKKHKLDLPGDPAQFAGAFEDARSLREAVSNPGTPDTDEECATLGRLAAEIDARADALAAELVQWRTVTGALFGALLEGQAAVDEYRLAAAGLRRAAELPVAAPPVAEPPVAEPPVAEPPGCPVDAPEEPAPTEPDASPGPPPEPRPAPAYRDWPCYEIREPDLLPPEYRLPDGSPDRYAIACAEGGPPAVPGVEYYRGAP